jgi:hypothetical protein
MSCAGVVRGRGLPTFDVHTFIEADVVVKGFAFEEGALVKESFAYYTDERIHVVRSVNLRTGARRHSSGCMSCKLPSLLSSRCLARQATSRR